jgi:hypothetical protein|nr:MAG TPA: protein of unknown function DUF859 [Bacteriophage sp.]
MNGTEFARISGKYSTAFIGTYERTGQNIAGDYSTFTIRVYGYYGGGTKTSSSYGTVWISGTQYSIGGYTLTPGYKLLASKDITVSHNGDGSFPYTTVAFAINSYHANGETSGAISAPTIPRQANVTGYNDFNDEQNPTITYNNPGGFRINARLEFAGTNIKRDNISNTGSYTFNLTDAERKLLRQKCTGSSMTVRGVIATCIGGTTENYWSYWDRTMTIVNGNPTFDNFNFVDSNTKTVALTGNNTSIVKGYSNVKVTIPTSMKATAKKEASLSKYRVSIGTAIPVDITYSSDKDVNGTVNNADSSTINVYAIDSRNNSKLVSKQATNFISYSNIEKGNIDVVRTNGVSEDVTLKINGTFNKVNFGKITNSIKSAQYRYRIKGTNTWSSYNNLTLTIKDNNFSYNGLIKGDTKTLGFNVEHSYEVEVLVKDELSEATFTDTFGSGTPNIALAKNGVGIMGKYNESVGGDLQIRGKNPFKRQVATAYLLNAANNIKNAYIPLDKIISNTDKLTLSGNGIKIGKGISKVLVSGNVFLAASANNSYLWTAIRKITSNGYSDGGIAIDNYNTYFASTCHAPHILEVVEGDLIKIFKIDDANGTIRNGANTYLTVEVIE